MTNNTSIIENKTENGNSNILNTSVITNNPLIEKNKISGKSIEQTIKKLKKSDNGD